MNVYMSTSNGASSLLDYEKRKTLVMILNALLSYHFDDQVIDFRIFLSFL